MSASPLGSSGEAPVGEGTVPGFVHRRYRSALPELVQGREAQRHAVLIAGGGPVGLAVALALARYGIRSVVAEADDTVCVGSRAICLSRRTLQILERLGAVDAFLEKGLAWTGGRSFHRDTQVLRFEMPNDADQRFAPMTNLQQYYIEQFLVDAVQEHSELITLRWSTRVESVTQATDRVAVTLATDGMAYETSAEYLIACDGARSSVRQALGLRMEGTAYEARYVIADIESAIALPTERLAWFDPPSAPGRTMLMHKQPDNLWRLDYQLHGEEDAETMLRPENVRAVIVAHLGMMGINAPWRLVWSSMYKASALSLPDYRAGRVLLAGDAAHLVPIFGVRGLNSGFDDVFNLGWKLACVLKGWAPESLLDSFSQERRGAWQTNVTQAMKSTAFMAPPSRGYEVMREAVLALAPAHPPLAALINPRQSNVISYLDSPLNSASGDEPAFRAGPSAGQPIPEAPVNGGGSHPRYLTQSLSDGFTLLVFHEGGPLARAFADLTREGRALEPPLTVVGVRPQGSPPPMPDATMLDIVDSHGRVRALFDMTPGTVYLIRPDGHVCGRWRSLNAAAIVAATRKALGFAGAREEKR